MIELSILTKKSVYFLLCLFLGHKWSSNNMYQMYWHQICWRCKCVRKIDNSSKIDMIINYNKKTHTLWHSDCYSRHAPPMKELSSQEDMTLMECTKCKAQGFYPHGKSGRVRVEQLNTKREGCENE